MTKQEWTVNCETCGAVDTWSEAAPTACPNDGVHTVSSVERVMEDPTGGQATAPGGIRMTDANGDVWEMVVDATGAWQGTKLT